MPCAACCHSNTLCFSRCGWSAARDWRIGHVRFDRSLPTATNVNDYVEDVIARLAWDCANRKHGKLFCSLNACSYGTIWSRCQYYVPFLKSVMLTRRYFSSSWCWMLNADHVLNKYYVAYSIIACIVCFTVPFWSFIDHIWSYSRVSHTRLNLEYCTVLSSNSIQSLASIISIEACSIILS